VVFDAGQCAERFFCEWRKIGIGASNVASMNEKPDVRHCPVCGTAMVADRSPSGSESRRRFSCLGCGAVVVVSRHPDEDGGKSE
jgi:hypothetical protein